MSNLAISNKSIDHAFEPIEGRPSQPQRSGWSKAQGIFMGVVLFPGRISFLLGDVIVHPLVYSENVTAAIGKVALVVAQKVKQISSRSVEASKREIIPRHDFKIMDLPADVRRYLWSFLDITDLGNMCLVSKCWNKEVVYDQIWESIARRINCPLENSGVPYYRQVIAFIRDLQRKVSSTRLDLTHKVNATAPSIEGIDGLQRLFQARDTLLVWEELAKSANVEVAGANVAGPGLSDLVTKEALLSKAGKFSDWFFENREILVQVRFLDLSKKQLTSIPDEICQIVNLQSLLMGENYLPMLPFEIGNLTNLVNLFIFSNQLTALPDGVDKLTNLQKLFLSRNQLTALPDGIGKLTNLQDLYLTENQLTALPDGVDKLTNLQDLYLGWNQLTALPDGVDKLTNLRKLDLFTNQLTVLPDGIDKLTNLQDLSLGWNQLTALPEGIGKLTNLQELHIAGNQISALPKGIENLRLKKLNLLGNPLPLKTKVASILNYNKLPILKAFAIGSLPVVATSIFFKEASPEYQVLLTTAAVVGSLVLAKLLLV